jgi:uncharacterized protein (TIGR02145 family)
MTRSKKTVFLFFMLTGCFIISTCVRKFEKVMNVSTGTSTDITSNSATVSGQIIDLGEGATQYGHYYGKTTGVKNTGIKTTNGVPKGTVSFTSKLNNLDAGIKYYYQAYLTDGKEIVYGSEISFSTIPSSTVPGAPTIGIATAGNAQATVTFTAPSSNGGSNITGYTVTSSPGGFIATGSASPITVTGLTNGTAYTFTITATNANGTGPASSASNSVTPSPTSTVPGAPTIGTATAGNAQATITFTAPGSNGGSVITGYTVTSSSGGFTATGSASPITVSGLTNGTAYTFTVVATNANGNSSPSSASNSVTPSATVTDIDGNIYNTVTIGSQVWMNENLKTTKYNDGTSIPLVTDSTQWGALSTPGYCWHNNDPATYANYGALYNWYTVDSGSNGGKNVCPIGWHVPTDAEWTTLTDYLTSNGYGYGGSGNDIAKSMAAKSGWSTSTIAGAVGNDQASNNSSGFTGIPIGDRAYFGPFSNNNEACTWWGSNYNTDNAYFHSINYNSGMVTTNYFNKRSGFQVRCLKNY